MRLGALGEKVLRGCTRLEALWKQAQGLEGHWRVLWPCSAGARLSASSSRASAGLGGILWGTNTPKTPNSSQSRRQGNWAALLLNLDFQKHWSWASVFLVLGVFPLPCGSAECCSAVPAYSCGHEAQCSSLLWSCSNQPLPAVPVGKKQQTLQSSSWSFIGAAGIGSPEVTLPFLMSCVYLKNVPPVTVLHPWFSLVRDLKPVIS